MTVRARLARAVLLLTFAGAGCDCFRDTPEQELARRRWRECASERRDVKLDRIDTDGRIRFTYVAGNDRDRVLECLERIARADRVLPEAVSSPVAGK